MKSTLHTPVCDLLGCDVPVVLSGMGGVARSELVAAVVEAGGFGFLGMVRESPGLIREEIASVRERTSRRFGVNLIPAATSPELLESELEVCLSLRVPAVMLFWDLRPDIVRRLRQAGILVVWQVGSLEEAIAAQHAGVDVLIVQGREAGGHVRGTQPLATLLPQVLAAVDRPVLAAGGLADGRDLARVIADGAQGAVFGTAFIATRESFAHDYHKQRIVEASGPATVLTTAFHINWPSDAPVRVLGNSVTRGEHGDPWTDAAPPRVIGEEAGRPIYLFSTDSPTRATSGNLEAMACYAGEGVSRVATIPAAAERVRLIVEEAEAARGQVRRSTSGGDPAIELSSPVCYAAAAEETRLHDGHGSDERARVP